MSFFFNAAKAAPKKAAGSGGRVRLQDIPVASLNQMGCKVCPKDKADLRTPKMEPEGRSSPTVYILGSAPSERDDDEGFPFSDKPGKEIRRKFGESWLDKNARLGYVQQCAGDQTVRELECCRLRVQSDVEASRPLVVVTVGDEPLRWATGGNGNAMASRGTLFAAKIGKHSCYVYSLAFPRYVHKKSYGRSEHELAFEHDIQNLKDMLDDLPAPQVALAPYDTGIEVITGQQPGDMQRLEQALQELAREPDGGLDYETNGLRPHFIKDPHIWMASVGTFERTVAFSVDHPDGWGSEHQRAKVRWLLLQYIMDSGPKACHNIAMEHEWTTYVFGDEVIRRTEWDDTMAGAHVLDSRSGTKALGKQTLMHFGFDVKAQSRIDPKRLLEYPIKEALRYNGLDNKWTHALRRRQAPLLDATPRYRELYETKVRTAATLVLTENIGIPVDFGYAKKMETALLGKQDDLDKRIRATPEIKKFRAMRGAFSPTNNDQVLDLYKTIMQRPEVRVEEKRGGETFVRWTTEEEALASMPRDKVPSAHLILEHRGVSKLLSTYVQPVLRRDIVCRDDRIRCKYSQLRTVTDRLASEDPNLQNWPKRKHREIRGMVAAPEGWWIVAADYGQIEFRVVGMASEDPNLVKYCWTGYDVHKVWAEKMVKAYPRIIDWVVEEFEVDWDEKGLKTLRQEAKNGWVFPQLFGSSTNSCAERLHLPEDVATRLGREFWDEFRVVKKWQDRLMANYEKNLYVETLVGARRRGAMTRNEAINMPIQGTAAAIVLEGMNALSERSQLEDNPNIHPAINVHDDLTQIVPDATLERDIAIISEEMCRPRFDFINVPLVVEVSVGSHWHNLEELKVYRSDEMFGIRNPYAKEQRA